MGDGVLKGGDWLPNDFATWSYVNSGVLGIPSRFCSRLRIEWEASLNGLLRIFAVRPGIATKRNFADQISLTLALERASIPICFLPPSLNFHTGGVSHGDRRDLRPPFILHYHGHVDNRGFLRRSGFPETDRAIHAFNLTRARADGLAYSRPHRRLLKVWMDKHSPMSSEGNQSGGTGGWKPGSVDE